MGFTHSSDEKDLIRKSATDPDAELAIVAHFAPRPGWSSGTGTFVTFGVRKADGCPMALVHSTVWPFSIPFNRETATAVEAAMREAAPDFDTTVDVRLGWSGLR